MTNKKMILEKAIEYSDYTSKNLSELIKLKSLSTKEGEVSNAIVKMMKDAGFELQPGVEPARMMQCPGTIFLKIDAEQEDVFNVGQVLSGVAQRFFAAEIIIRVQEVDEVAGGKR